MRQTNLWALLVGVAILAGCGDAGHGVTEAGRRTVGAMDLAAQPGGPREVSWERGLSFPGAKFRSAIVARVRLTAGDTPIGASAFDDVTGVGEMHDIDVGAMEDFIDGESRTAIN